MAPFITSLILSLFILDIKAQIVQQSTENACASKTTCHECIQTPSCAWCSDTFFSTTARCFQPTSASVPLDNCDPEKIYDPHNELNIIQNVFVSTGKNASRIVQVSPQRLRLKLRARQTYAISMYYTQAISSTVEVEMKHNASMSAVNIKFFSKCLNPNGEITETNKCGVIKVGSLVEFRVELEVLKCPKKQEDWSQIIQIYPVGINESLIIELEMLCDCSCEHPDHPSYIENANECFSKGTFMCGICDCHYGLYGSHCECLKNETNHIPNSNCINPKTGLVCSGRGICICGICECEQRSNPLELIYNEFCECDNFSCERHNGLLCGGEDHGICDCGECKCKDQWEGRDCSCLNSTDTCKASPNDTVLCSGHGTCECGTCKCETTNLGPYSGKFCERYSISNDCKNYKDCVYCEMFTKGLDDKKCETCRNISPLIGVDILTVDNSNHETLCAFYDEDQCRYSFVYFTDRDGIIGIRVKNERECPPK